MGKAVLKWLASIGVGVVYAIVAAVSAHTGNGPDLGDPAIGGIFATLLTKAVTWLTSKLPAQPTASSNTNRPYNP